MTVVSPAASTSLINIIFRTSSTPIMPGYSPWLVRFFMPNSNRSSTKNSTDGHQCSGNLINKCWVVAPAHCFVLSKLEKSFAVRIGNIPNGVSEEPFEARIDKVIKHPDFNTKTLSNNIALVKLEKCLPSYTIFRSPICLPDGKRRFHKEELCHISTNCNCNSLGKCTPPQYCDKFGRHSEKYESLSQRRKIAHAVTWTNVDLDENQSRVAYIRSDDACSKQYGDKYKYVGSMLLKC